MIKQKEQKNKPLISVIVPVYNVEPYLEHCISSIVNQTYKNLEIIIVDDGSKDNCSTIIANWEKIDSRIKVIHQENKGLSGARNTGLDCATGELVEFVDSDDYIDFNLYEVLFNAINEFQADIAMVPCRNDNFCRTDFPFVLSAHEALLSLLKGEQQSYVFNKLFKSNIIKDKRFIEGMNFEDLPFTSNIFAKMKTLVVCNGSSYHYIVRNNSITQTKSIKNSRDAIKGLEFFRDTMLENGFQSNPFYCRFEFRLYLTLLFFYYKLKDNSFDYAEIKQKMQIERKKILSLFFPNFFFLLKNEPKIFVKYVIVLFFPPFQKILYKRKYKNFVFSENNNCLSQTDVEKA